MSHTSDLDFGSIIGIVNNVIAYSSHYQPFADANSEISLHSKDISKCQIYNKYDNLSTHYINGVFYGLKWQCVEFSRRYLILNHNITFTNVVNAYNIFELEYFTLLDNSIDNSIVNSIVPIYKYINGSNIRPHIGSLLIWNKHDDDITGHVAVITKINLDNIEIGEQNYKNIKWSNNYSRTLPFKDDNGFHIIDTHIIGWINII